MSGAVLVTGVGRRRGIGFAVARRLLAEGRRVVVHSWAPHDDEQPWGADELETLLGEPGAPPHVAADVADPPAPAALVDRARELAGPLTGLVVDHARVQAFAAQHDPASGPASVVLMTSGEHRGPMPGELAYVLSKGALQQATATLTAELADRRIAVTCVNPGPVDTGWADDATRAAVAARFPSGAWTTPAEAAEVVAWLVGPGGPALNGTTVDAEHGFRR